jgi:predicted O-methyltransferase YrrM
MYEPDPVEPDPRRIQHICATLGKLVRKSKDIASWVDIAFRSYLDWWPFPHIGRAYSFPPTQVKSEITAFLQRVEGMGARRVLEIGTSNGGTLFLLARASAPDATLISVDLPEGVRGAYEGWRDALYRAFAAPGQAIHLLRADSHTLDCLRQIRAILKGELLDVLFIDADHEYAGVARDFQMYSPLVRKGGLIGLHDIVADHKTRYGADTGKHSGGVHKFWQELKAVRPATELIENPNQDGFGIGVVQVGDEESMASPSNPALEE